MKATPLTRRQIQGLISTPETKFVCSSFVILCRLSSEIRVSILVGKKLGIAVRRNRIRRRLREAFRQAQGFPSGDYAIMGRVPSQTVSFQVLLEQMREAQKKLGKPKV